MAGMRKHYSSSLIEHVFLLDSKPEHPLALTLGEDWEVVRTTVTGAGTRTDEKKGTYGRMVRFTHYVRVPGRE